MRKVILLLFAMVMFVPTAMARDEETVSYRKSTSEARLLDFNPPVAPVPLSVEIKVIGQRIHEKFELSPEQLNKRIINNNYKQTVENLRIYAVYIASGIYDCDLIVGARFNFEITDKGGFVEIYGYPANFVNWGGKVGELPVAKPVNPDYGKNL